MNTPRDVLDSGESPGTTRTCVIDDSTIVYDSTQANGFDPGDGAAAVTLVNSENRVVAFAADGEGVYGKLLHVDPDGFCAVATGGLLAFVAGDGATVSEGQPIVGAEDASNNPGFIRNVDTADDGELAVAAGKITSADDTDAVIVDFGA